MDTSLGLLDTATTALGNALRYFVQVTCPKFDTFETSSEYTKRQRQQAAAAPSTSRAEPSSTGRQRRTFSLKTIKLHFLGDYVSCIKMFGTTDNYNSALVSCVSTLPFFTRSELNMIRGRTATTESNSTLSQGAITRRPHNNSVRWIILISRSAASRTTSRGPASPFLARFPHPLPPPSHSRSPSSLLPQATSLESISHTGYVIVVMIPL